MGVQRGALAGYGLIYRGVEVHDGLCQFGTCGAQGEALVGQVGWWRGLSEKD
jgi:hypothetical protein